MKIYEEFDSPALKRKAQKGAKRGVATGKASGYLLVFNEDGIQHSSVSGPYYEALGELMQNEGPGSAPQVITSANPSLKFLRIRCRAIGFDTLPEVWKRAFADKLDDCLDNSIPELKAQRRRYRKVLAWAA